MDDTKKSEEDLNNYLNNLLNNDKKQNDAVNVKMESIKKEEQKVISEEESDIEDALKEEKGLFFISDEDISDFDKDIEVEKYVDLKKYGIEKEGEKSENKNVEDKGSEGQVEDLKSFEKIKEDDLFTQDKGDKTDNGEGIDLLGSKDDYDDEDDNGLIDLNDPDVYQADNNSSGVSFDELNEKGLDQEDEDLFSGDGKKSFDELNRSSFKKGFEPGKMNKNNMILFICIFIGLIFLGFTFATRDKDKKSEKGGSDNGVNINDYSPDFGNYKERGYKNPKEENKEMEDEALNTLNSFVDPTGKETYKGEEKPVETVTYVNSGANNTLGGNNVSSDEYTERVTSSLRKGINDYKDYNSGVSYDGSQNYIPSYTDTKNDVADDYFKQLGNITSSLGGGKDNNSNYSASLRFSDGGKYERNKEGGGITSIPPNSIYPGYIIPAVLVSGINTDYPGDITARVTGNVYDSRTGSVLLIPSGSILRGSYSSSSIGISRIQIAWQSLIINRNGVDFIVNLGSMVGTDSKGYSGLGGSLNDHYFAYLKAAGLSALFTYINSSVYSVSKAQKNKVTADMISDAQEVGQKLSDKLLERAMDIEPTVTVKGGTRINVDVNKVLTLIPFEKDKPKSRYKR